MKKKTVIFIIILSVFLISLFGIGGLFIYNNYFKIDPNGYVRFNQRETYIIKQFDETYLSKYLNKKEKTLIVFFSTRCGYCVDEANDLNNFLMQNPKIQTIIVSHDAHEASLQYYLEENKYKWFTILDSEKKIREYLEPGSSGIPCVYLLDKDGKIINQYEGPLTCDQFKSFYEGNKIEEQQ